MTARTLIKSILDNCKDLDAEITIGITGVNDEEYDPIRITAREDDILIEAD